MADRAEFFSSMLGAAQVKFGKTGCYVAREHARTHYGVPLDNLALRFLFTTNVLSLERLCEFFGARGSGKSSLCYELARLFIEAGGIATVVETENKTSFDLISAIVGEKNLDMLQFFRSGLLEDAMDELSYSIEYYKKNCKERNIPYLVIWDSLTGSKSKETVGRVTDDGHSSKSFPAEAGLISQYFGTLPEAFLEWPIAMCWTNHEKEDIDSMGRGPGYKTAGGKAPGFYATYQVRVACTKNVVRTAANPYMTVRFQTKKNNLGISGRRVDVNLYFSRSLDPVTKKWVANTYFDWDRATVDLLMSPDLPGKAVVKDIVCVAKASAGYNCQALGLKGVNASELCAALYANEALYAELQAALGIAQWREFNPEEPVYGS